MLRHISKHTLQEIQSLVQQGLQLAMVQRYEAAIECLNKAVEIDPLHSQALDLLAEIHRIQGRYEEALEYANHLLSHVLIPTASNYNTRGAIYNSMARYDEAISDYEKAIKTDKKQVAAYSNLINTLRTTNQGEKALKVYQKATQLGLIHSDMYNNVGLVYFEQKSYQKALDALVQSLQLNETNAPAQINILRAQIEIDDKNIHHWLEKYNYTQCTDTVLLQKLLPILYINKNIDILQDIVFNFMTTMPSKAVFHLLLPDQMLNMLFYVLDYFKQNNRYEDAKKLYAVLDEISPNNIAILNNLGSTEFSYQKYELAIGQFKRVIALAPETALAHRNAGACCLALGRTLEALTYYQSAHQHNPLDQHTIVQILSVYLQIADWTNFYTMREQLKIAMQQEQTDTIGSLQILSLSESIAEQYDYLKKTANSVFLKKYPFNYNIKRKPKATKIRLAYLSFDFRDHPVSYLTCELFGLHDRKQFEIIAYSYGPNDGSQYRQRIASSVDVFYDFSNTSMVAMAEKIYSDNVDILVDLTGNTQHTRSSILAYKLADTQMHWLGYVATMGSDCYDYIISDDFTTPEKYEQYYTEKILRLPLTLQINDRQRTISTQTMFRKDYGLPEDAFVFCNFGQIFKIQPKMFESWVNILKAVPNSVLWLAEQDPIATGNVINAFIKHEINSNRIVFAKRLPIPQYLARYKLADLMLDTYPVGSGTSASDCLWAGCPLLMLAGEIMYSRMCGGILKAAKLDDFITESFKQYEEKAIYYSNNKQGLEKIRKNLVKNRDKLPLFDTPKRVDALEVAFKKVVENHRKIN
jgi:protein O-GlcNAc transferase